VSTPEVTVRSSIEFGFEFRARFVTGVTGASETLTLPKSEIIEVHPFAGMVGVLRDHPLRDEFLEILGMGQENR
jgi:hypothetical protein